MEYSKQPASRGLLKYKILYKYVETLQLFCVSKWNIIISKIYYVQCHFFSIIIAWTKYFFVRLKLLFRLRRPEVASLVVGSYVGRLYEGSELRQSSIASKKNVNLISWTMANLPWSWLRPIIFNSFSTHRCRSGQPRSLSVTTRHVSIKTAHFEQFCWYNNCRLINTLKCPEYI